MRAASSRPSSVIAAAMLASVEAGTLPASAASDAPYQSFDLAVIHAPQPSRIDGAEMLFYEIHVTNLATAPLTIRSVEVIADDGKTGGSPDLPRSIRSLPAKAGDAIAAIDPGKRSIIYASIPWSQGTMRRLRHRIAFDAGGAKSGERLVVTGAETTIDGARRPALAPPLRGGPWAAVYAPEMDFGHRRHVYTVHGKARIPGRFAIDWMPAAGFVAGSTGQSTSADGEGADVLAVGDGVIVTAKQTSDGRTAPSIEDETGAMIVLDIGHGRFAFYEHLAPRLLVKPGQKVRRGQVIARLGSTGHVTQPHLHFHVADDVGPLSSEGVPYQLSSAWITGRYSSIEDFTAGKAWTKSAIRPVDGLPAANAVVMFR